jgi:hypothetical protein
MDTNAVIIVLAEPFGLDDRRDILAEIVLQEVRQNFLPARLRVLCPSLRYRLSAQWQAVLTSPHSGRDDDQARRTTPARFPLPHGEAAPCVARRRGAKRGCGTQTRGDHAPYVGLRKRVQDRSGEAGVGYRIAGAASARLRTTATWTTASTSPTRLL